MTQMTICFRRRLVHGLVRDESRPMRAENFGDGPEVQALVFARQKVVASS